MTFGLSKETFDRILQVFTSHSSIEEAIIYGSRAMNSHKKGSDIDITFKGCDLNLHELNNISMSLDDLLLPYTFDLSIYSQIKNQDLIDHIARVGKRIYKKQLSTNSVD